MKYFFGAALALSLWPGPLAAQGMPPAADSARRHHWFVSSNVKPLIQLVTQGSYTYGSDPYDVQFYCEPVLVRGGKGWRFRAGFAVDGYARTTNDDNQPYKTERTNSWFKLMGVFALERIWQLPSAPLRFGLGPVAGPRFERQKSEDKTVYQGFPSRTVTGTEVVRIPGLYLGAIASVNWQAVSWLMLGADAQLALSGMNRVDTEKRREVTPDGIEEAEQKTKLKSLELNYLPLWRINANFRLR